MLGSVGTFCLSADVHSVCVERGLEYKTVPLIWAVGIQ
jgi:hypothetical protein